ncbi:MAG: hypothetical protein HY690_17425 [Chloroflexi bacterium]|nr:hypothetical protein [Chloroflexota bacterium]
MIPQQPARSGDDDLHEVKRLAGIKLEADLHAYLNALAAAGLSEEEAIALARATLRAALARATERRTGARER